MYVLDELRKREQIKVLHISDTPDIIYSFVFSVVDRLKPDYIIHTGDLVDNIKLASGAPLKLYKKSLKVLMEGFKQRDWSKIYIIPGNHDNVDLLKEMVTDHIQICNEGSTIDINGVKIGLSHYDVNLPDEADVYLYGHDKTVVDNGDEIYLNGLLDLNVIFLPGKETETLSYPLKTDSGRQYKRLKLP